MALFSAQELDERARQATEQSTATTTSSTPPQSAYADALMALAGKVGGTGDAYANLISQSKESLGGEAAARAFAARAWPNYTGGWDTLPKYLQDEAWKAVGGKIEAPVYDAAGARGRADAYAKLLDETGRPMIERGAASLEAGGPSRGIVDKLRATAMDPIDDDLEAYFRGEFEKDTDAELARLGLVGQGRGMDLKFDARNRYAMDRREGADARRISAGDAATRLTAADLDAALREMTAGAGFTTGAYGARDTAEKDIYNADLTTTAMRATLPYQQLAQLAQLGGMEAGLRGAPASLFGSLYAIDQGRLNQGRTVTQTGATSGSDSSTRDLTKTPSALTSTSDLLKLAPLATQAVSNLAPAAKGGADFLSSLFSSTNGSFNYDPYDPSLVNAFGF